MSESRIGQNGIYDRSIKLLPLEHKTMAWDACRVSHDIVGFNNPPQDRSFVSWRMLGGGLDYVQCTIIDGTSGSDGFQAVEYAQDFLHHRVSTNPYLGMEGVVKIASTTVMDLNEHVILMNKEHETKAAGAVVSVTINKTEYQSGYNYSIAHLGDSGALLLKSGSDQLVSLTLGHGPLYEATESYARSNPKLSLQELKGHAMKIQDALVGINPRFLTSMSLEDAISSIKQELAPNFITAWPLLDNFLENYIKKLAVLEGDKMSMAGLGKGIGWKKFEPDHNSGKLDVGDRLALVSDGIYALLLQNSKNLSYLAKLIIEYNGDVPKIMVALTQNGQIKPQDDAALSIVNYDYIEANPTLKIG